MKHPANPEGYKLREGATAENLLPRSGWQRNGENSRLLPGGMRRIQREALHSHIQTAIKQKVCFLSRVFSVVRPGVIGDSLNCRRACTVLHSEIKAI